MLKLFKPSDETKLVLNTLDPASLIRTLSYIGGGAHGKVYKIYNMLDDQVYSLKKIDLMNEISSNDSFSSLKDNSQLLLREIRVLAQLDHPNILRYNTSWIEFDKRKKPILCIQTKFYEHTLTDIIFNENLNKENVWKDIINAIKYLHSKGIMHRDLKSDNIFVDTNMQNAYVGDFGLAKYCENNDSRIMSDLYMGSELYLAPESKSNTPVYTFESDIYSLGIIYLQLFSQCQSSMEFISIFKSSFESFNVPALSNVCMDDMINDIALILL
jgi:serine/threonine protein kinase